jgi:hypothetical protein
MKRPALPDGITIEQIAAALEALTTARVSIRGTVRVKGTDVPVRGDGVVDFSRHIGFTSLAVNGRQEESLFFGRDRFRRLPPGRQRQTGKLWLWSEGDDGYWHQMLAAMPQVASCTGSGAETLSGEPVHRCSFLLKPQRASLLTRLGKTEDPSVAELYATLAASGRDRVFLDVWLADDHALRKVREHSTALELALLDGVTRVVEITAEYSDFGVSVDLVAPSADQVLGYPAELHLVFRYPRFRGASPVWESIHSGSCDPRAPCARPEPAED